MTWRRSRKLLASLAIWSLVAVGCGSTQPVARTVVLVPLPQAPQPAAPTAAVPPPAARAAPRRSVPAPQLTVQVTRPVRLHGSPGGPVVGGLLPRTQFRSATIVPVVAQRGAWLGIITSALPNGRLGWIEASTALVAYTTPYAITASLRHRQVVVRRYGRVFMRFPVAVGSPSTPTPTGRFAVTDKLLTNDPSSPYGCCILALSARQPHTPQGWGGGDRIAIHATDLPETIGSAASLGCLRAPAADVRRLLRSVPIGTVVTISA